MSKTSIEIVIPVLNEEVALPKCIATLSKALDQCDWDWKITIADNGSEDSTPEVSQSLAEQNPNLFFTRLEQRGRGLALKKAWVESEADIRCFMDVDLSTRLDALQPLITSISHDGFDVAIGSRLLPKSKVVGRSLKREITSRGYNALIGLMFPRRGFRDAQCGFKAISREVADRVVPHIENKGWFFDTELLLLSLKAGYKIKEIPVHWEDDPDTRVRIISTATEDLKGLLRIRFKPPRVQHRNEPK